MFRILNAQSKTITGAAIILSGASLLSRLVGLLRDRVLAHYFGAGATMDAYYAAFKVPDLIYNLLIVGALTAGFIPTFTKLLNEERGNDKTQAWQLANNVLNILGIGLIILCALGAIFTPQLNAIVAPGFNGQNLERVILFTRIMFLSPLLLGVSMIMGGILQSLRRFALYALSPVFYNLGIIFGATGLYKTIGEAGLAWGVVLGALLHCSIQIYGAKQAGWRWQWRFNWKDKDTKNIWRLMVPRTLGLAITQFNQVIITMLASFLPVGSIAVYNYANNIQAVPIGIIGLPFAMAVFPLLSTAAAQKDIKNFIEHLSATMRQIIFLVVPASVIILLLRAQIVRVILGSGEFNWEATINTADALAFFALGLLAQSLIHLFARAFYALSNTKTPFVIGIIAELISIIAALLLMKNYGAPGLALASTIGATINAAILFAALRQHTKSMDEDKLLPLLYKVSIATICMAVVVQFLKYPLAKIFNQDYFWGIFGQGAVAGLIGLAIYCLLCYILKIPEFIQIKNSFAKRWLKPKNMEVTEIFEAKD